MLFAEYRSDECYLLNIFMLSVVMLGLLMLSVLMLSVVLLCVLMLNVLVPFSNVLQKDYIIVLYRLTYSCSFSLAVCKGGLHSLDNV